uniref:peptidase inhibitor 15-like n=1 Tax=Monopterus albus TaxID=43700 RepID=UPI0009B393F7|nr:peptidase inhibitor 15-like [Monopterus albus]
MDAPVKTRAFSGGVRERGVMAAGSIGREKAGRGRVRRRSHHSANRRSTAERRTSRTAALLSEVKTAIRTMLDQDDASSVTFQNRSHTIFPMSTEYGGNGSSVRLTWWPFWIITTKSEPAYSHLLPTWSICRSFGPRTSSTLLFTTSQVDAHTGLPLTTWDSDLARTAEAWAATCLWEHGPAYLLQFYGQNLSVRTGGYHSILQLVKPWYDEANDYVFPYPPICNPSCPLLCYGPTCTHYTQMVWASTKRLGCAVQTCYNMFVWGALWKEATFLVCNYSPKGNWIGEAPYRVGIPCSACPSSYRGICSNNMCFPAVQSNYMYWFK